MKCQHCGHKLTPDAAFCGNCGTPPNKDSIAVAVPAPPTAPRPPVTKAASAIIAPEMPGPANPFAGQLSDKNYFTTFLLAFFLGLFGVDRFYTGQVGLGITKLLFSWLTLGIWPLVDVILILAGSRKDKFGRPLYGRDKDFKSSIVVFLIISGLVVVGNVGLAIVAVLNDDSLTSNNSVRSGEGGFTELYKPFGSAITLSDSDGYSFTITTDRFTTNTQSIDPSYSPPSGKRLVTVALTVKAGSDGPISENAVSSARLFDKAGYAYAPDATEVTGCPSFPEGYIDIDSGETNKGCLTFLVPSDSQINRFRFLPYSELSNLAATWDITQ